MSWEIESLVQRILLLDVEISGWDHFDVLRDVIGKLEVNKVRLLLAYTIFAIGSWPVSRLVEAINILAHRIILTYYLTIDLHLNWISNPTCQSLEICFKLVEIAVGCVIKISCKRKFSLIRICEADAHHFIEFVKKLLRVLPIGKSLLRISKRLKILLIAACLILLEFFLKIL